MERPHGERRQHVQTQYSQNILIRANFQPEIREKTGWKVARGVGASETERVWRARRGIPCGGIWSGLPTDSFFLLER